MQSNKDKAYRLFYLTETYETLNFRDCPPFSYIKETKPEKLWEGAWKRMKGAEMAGFADHRTYLYNDEKIDDQNHMGVDLASFANSPIEAVNDGVVIFAQKQGIYGLTVVIDHGQGSGITLRASQQL